MRCAAILPMLAVAIPLVVIGDTAEAADGKYQFMKATENRVWRLDTSSGEIAVCTLDGERLLCTTSSDAAMPPKKSYGEVQAERVAKLEQSAEQKRQREEQEMKMLDRLFAFFREMIAMAKE